MTSHSDDRLSRVLTTLGTAPPDEDDSRGLWRDGDLVVVARNRVQYPDRCILTGMPTNGTMVNARLGYQSSTGRRATLQIALPAKPTMRILLGRFLLVSGMVAVLVSAGFATIGFGFGEDVGESGMVAFACTPIIMLVGAVLLMLKRVPNIEVAKSEGDLIWLSGASESFIDDLPAWSREAYRKMIGSSSDQHGRMRRRLAQRQQSSSGHWVFGGIAAIFALPTAYNLYMMYLASPQQKAQAPVEYLLAGLLFGIGLFVVVILRMATR